MAKLDKRQHQIPGFTVRDNTLIKEKLPDPARRIEIEIGDEKEPDRFLPQFKTKHWDNETNFSVRLVDDDYDGGTVQTRKVRGKDVAEWSRAGRTARFYELDGYEDGGFEFEVELAEKPADNVLRFSIRTKEFNFYYQPELTEEEKAEGANRPEDVVGSYAVYHKSKAHNRVGGKHYRTGKAFHIYRPYAEDATGERVWCELNIDETRGELTVTVPQDFLDSVVYPVLVDPTFGYESVGGSSIDALEFISVGDVSPADDGDLTTISTYIDFSNSRNANVGIYTANGTAPGTHIANGTSRSVTGEGWEDWSVDAAITATSEYWLAMQVDNPSFNDHIPYDSTVTATDVRYDNSWIYDSWPDDPSLTFDNNAAFSIYATYTASGGGTSTNDERSAEAHGSQDTSAERSSEAHGQETANGERASETHGSDTATAERSAEAAGQSTENAERSAEIEGDSPISLTAALDGQDITLTWTYDP